MLLVQYQPQNVDLLSTTSEHTVSLELGPTVFDCLTCYQKSVLLFYLTLKYNYHFQFVLFFFVCQQYRISAYT